MAKKEDSTSTTKKIAGCIIGSCSCKSEFQDATYGKGMRVKNCCAGGSRCTVCKADNKGIRS